MESYVIFYVISFYFTRALFMCHSGKNSLCFSVSCRLCSTQVSTVHWNQDHWEYLLECHDGIQGWVLLLCTMTCHKNAKSWINVIPNRGMDFHHDLKGGFFLLGINLKMAGIAWWFMCFVAWSWKLSAVAWEVHLADPECCNLGGPAV